MTTTPLDDQERAYIDYLRKLDLNVLTQRIAAFWEHPPAGDHEVFSRFFEVLQTPDGSARFRPTGHTWPEGQTMWRVRQVRHQQGMPGIPGMSTESDLWEAPTQFVTRRGRLNEVGESVLYCSIGNPVVAMREARVPGGETFALIRYETTRRAKLTSIADQAIPAGLPAELTIVHQAITTFFRDVFTREFTDDDWTYVLSNRIVKDWFDLPPQWVDGWTFPSIVHGQGVNAAFRPDKAHDALQVTGIAYCESVDSALLGWQLKARAFSPGPNGSGDFFWHPWGSDYHRGAFPEFPIQDASTAALEPQ